MKTKVNLILLWASFAVCLGCSKSVIPPASPSSVRWRPPEIRLPEHFQPSRKPALPGFEKTTIEAYRKIGARNSKWDANAEAALRLWAYQICDEGSVVCGPEIKVMRGAIGQALKDGCDDPLVMYAAIRTDRNSEDMLVREWPTTFYTRMIKGLEKHPYPPIRQAMILERGAEAIWDISETQLTPELKRQAITWWNRAVDKLAEVDLSETDHDAIYSAVDCLLEAYRNATGDRKLAYDRIMAALESNASRKGIIPLKVKGGFYITWAWDARGNGFAHTVTEEGWRLFYERLKIARSALEEAWSQDQTDAFICQRMINVAAGEGEMDEIDLWFQRGKRVNPGFYELYGTKLNFIQSKWGGSDEEMLALGRECLKEGLWAERIPFILVGAHDWIAMGSEADISKYFSKPGVWEEIEPVYIEYLSRFPSNFGFKSAYAYRAGLAERWELANRLLDELSTNVVSIGFGTMGRFKTYRNEIRRHRTSQGVAASR